MPAPATDAEGTDYSTQELAENFEVAWTMIGQLHDRYEELQAICGELLLYTRELERRVDGVIEWKGDELSKPSSIEGRDL